MSVNATMIRHPPVADDLLIASLLRPGFMRWTDSRTAPNHMAKKLSVTEVNCSPLLNPMVFVYESCIGGASGCVLRSVPVCLDASGASASSNCELAGMTSDGQYILFVSPATNFGLTDNGIRTS